MIPGLTNQKNFDRELYGPYTDPGRGRQDIARDHGTGSINASRRINKAGVVYTVPDGAAAQQGVPARQPLKKRT